MSVGGGVAELMLPEVEIRCFWGGCGLGSLAGWSGGVVANLPSPRAGGFGGEDGSLSGVGVCGWSSICREV
jgi:hypothetical protein